MILSISCAWHITCTHSLMVIVWLLFCTCLASQAACIPHILSGNDVVVAAETGSGKTHGYLVPLIDKICGTSDPHGIRNDSQESPNPYKCSVILCPNVMLCEQVVRMASCLCDGNGEPLLRISAVCGRQVIIFALFSFFFFKFVFPFTYPVNSAINRILLIKMHLLYHVWPS